MSESSGESKGAQVSFLKGQVERFIKREKSFTPVLGQYEARTL